MDLEAVYLWHHLPGRTEQEIPTAVREEQLHHQAVRGAEHLPEAEHLPVAILHQQEERQPVIVRQQGVALQAEAMQLLRTVIRRRQKLIIP